VDWLLNYGIDDNAGRSGQGVGSWLCAVSLEDISGDSHDGLVIHSLKLGEWVTSGDLKLGSKFRCGFLPPPAEEDFAGKRRHVSGCSDDF